MFGMKGGIRTPCLDPQAACHKLRQLAKVICRLASRLSHDLAAGFYDILDGWLKSAYYACAACYICTIIIPENYSSAPSIKGANKDVKPGLLTV